MTTFLIKFLGGFYWFMKLKKCLLTGFSLGLSAITVGAVVSSCATSASQATDPNPASANSVSTNPGDPLTPDQQAYQQKLAAEIKVQFDANANLNYSNPTDKANIDEQISEYDKELSTGDLGALNAKISSLLTLGNIDNPSKEYVQEVNNLFSVFYDNFKQKNLLPTEDEINKYLSSSSAIPKSESPIDWKAVAASFGVFYTNPKDIILLYQCMLLGLKTETSFDTTKINSYYLLTGTFPGVMFFYYSQLSTITPSIQCLKIYAGFFDWIKDNTSIPSFDN